MRQIDGLGPASAHHEHGRATAHERSAVDGRPIRPQTGIAPPKLSGSEEVRMVMRCKAYGYLLAEISKLQRAPAKRLGQTTYCLRRQKA